MTGNLPVLSTIVFTPLAGAVLMALFVRRGAVARVFAFAVTLLEIALCGVALAGFDSGSGAMQLEEKSVWIRDFGIAYHLGVDGISILMIGMTAVITAVALLSSWRAVNNRVVQFCFFILLLETGMMGVFASLDLVLFYVFWEATLVPMYFLIGMWGGERRIYATIKFFIYTMGGSILMLIGIIAVFFMHRDVAGFASFDLADIGAVAYTVKAQMWLFAAFALAFAIKVPMFPFHTWLPDAHVEAPTAGSVILAGVMLKMGAYGFLRFALPLFPDAAGEFAPWICALAVTGIVYGALVAMVQRDVKKLVAYSSVSHLGFVMLGIFAFNIYGLQGGVLQMLNHGFSTGALFLLVGMIYERRHTREILEFGGIAKVMPGYHAIFLIVMLSSIGLPGLNGFVGEFLVLAGAFRASAGMAAVAATGVVLSAIYMMWMFQRVMYGPVKNEKNSGLADLTLRERAVLVPMLVFIFWVGLYSKPFTAMIEKPAQGIINTMKEKRAAARHIVEGRQGILVTEAAEGGRR